MYKFFKKYHKWVGLPLCFFLIMSALSGILMNHRKAVSSFDISRNLLPEEYRYSNWNNASVKGSFRLSEDSVLLYGGAGIWLTDNRHTSFHEFNKGLKKGADNRIISNIVRTGEGVVYAASTFDLYQLGEDLSWINISCRMENDERIADLAVSGDSLLVLTRSYLYASPAADSDFARIELQKPSDYSGKVTLFRTLWLLHSGELFGLAGQLFVDGLGLLILLLCITGLIYFFCPGIIKRRRRKEKPVKATVSVMKSSVKWHNKTGAVFLIFFLILVVSGMFLRPPLLIAIVRSKVQALPGTVLSDKNPWHDKLRTLRYDAAYNEWLLYSSDGFYRLKELSSVPLKMERTPPVSVMGVTVMEPVDSTGWVTGSFSGLFYWERAADIIVDCNTGRVVAGTTRGRPVAGNPVSGYAGDFKHKKIVFEYNRGARVFDSDEPFADMPAELKDGRMSLWHLCLEIHTGRIYGFLIGAFSDVYVFLLGLLSALVFISGYIVYRRRPKTKKDPTNPR